MKRVLVVEDDSSIRDLLRTVLRRERFDVTTLDSGLHAAHNIAQDNYDVTFLDLMMARANGYEVVNRVSAESPERLRDIVVITAVPKERARQEGLPVDLLRGYLQKPFDIKDVIRYAHADYS